MPVGPPSFAAVTASIDRTGMPFMMHVQAQRKAGKGAAEVIENLDVIVGKFLYMYRRRTNAPPVKIIYFRDGVGDGQFQEVGLEAYSLFSRIQVELFSKFLILLILLNRCCVRKCLPSGRHAARRT